MTSVRIVLFLTLAGICGAQQAAAPANLALHKPAKGSTSCNEDESADKAFNGTTNGGTSDKWCSTEDSKWLQVDLGANVKVNRIVIKHAGSGDEDTAWNTRAFKINVSTDGKTFNTVVNVTDNAKDVTTHTITPVVARYVQLEVIVPSQDGDEAARIYEVEVYGEKQ